MTEPSDPDAVGLDFLRTEIHTGMTFAGLAADAGSDVEKRDRNRRNAQKAHAALLKFAPRVHMSQGERDEVTDGIDRLALAIAAIPV